MSFVFLRKKPAKTLSFNPGLSGNVNHIFICLFERVESQIAA